MHNLFLVYFVNLYLFQAYLGPSSGGTTQCVLYKQNIKFNTTKINTVQLLSVPKCKIISTGCYRWSLVRGQITDVLCG